VQVGKPRENQVQALLFWWYRENRIDVHNGCAADLADFRAFSTHLTAQETSS
jgi:hypothetical protein